MKSIPIFLSSDNNYAPFVATTIASICNNTKSFCDFYILDGGIQEENKEKICELKKQFINFSIEFIKIDLEKEFSTIHYENCCKHVSLSTYNRFLIPKLKPELKRVLYLDVDIIVLGDISELYNQDLEGYMLGAIPEQINEKEINLYKQILKLSETHHYFNAGILLIDLEQWILEDIMSKLFEIESKRRNDLLHADQDVLNICFNDSYKVLDFKFNYETNNNQELEQDKQEIVIRHFNTGIKPWNILPTVKTNLINNIDDFYYYLSKTPFNKSVLDKCEYKYPEQLHKLRLIKLLEKKRVPTIEDCIKYKNKKQESIINNA